MKVKERRRLSSNLWNFSVTPFIRKLVPTGRCAFSEYTQHTYTHAYTYAHIRLGFPVQVAQKCNMYCVASTSDSFRKVAGKINCEIKYSYASVRRGVGNRNPETRGDTAAVLPSLLSSGLYLSLSLPFFSQSSFFTGGSQAALICLCEISVSASLYTYLQLYFIYARFIRGSGVARYFFSQSLHPTLLFAILS